MNDLRHLIGEIEEEMPFLEREEQDQLRRDLSRYREELRGMRRGKRREVYG